MTWPAHFPNPTVPNAQMPTGFHHPSIHDYYSKKLSKRPFSERDFLSEQLIILILANPQMAQQLLALQQYQAAEQYNSGTGLPSYPTVSNACTDFSPPA